MDAAISAGTLQVSAVWSDGANHASGDVGGMWWPTISFPLYGSTMWGLFCQGLALQNGASPWHVYLDRLEIYGEYGFIQVNMYVFLQQNNEEDDQDSEEFITAEKHRHLD